MSFRRIGLSRSSSVIGSSPLVTVIIAVIILGERPAPLVYFGTLLIVAGVISLAREQQTTSKEEGQKKSIWHYFIFVVLATLMFGVAGVFRKAGIPLVPNLSVAMCMAALGTLLVIVCWHPFLAQEYRIQIKRTSMKYFLISSICLTAGHLSFFAALQRGPLSTVAPLVYTTPLFALGFSWVLIRQIERLNSRLVLGAFLLCAGGALVTMSRV
jgi:drug/metabolite transporter (DMT)-like permease